jgi:transcription elongation GreA/GreB family factor
LDKVKLIEFIRKSLEKDLAILKEAERSTREAATHEESKPENEYDTRGLEASYLAGAQSKRIAETEELLVIFKHVEPKKFSDKDPISATALVEVELKGKNGFFFVMPKGGGVTVNFEGKRVQVVTPNSPLGESLLGLKVGDIAIVENGDQVLEYDILSIK